MKALKYVMCVFAYTHARTHTKYVHIHHKSTSTHMNCIHESGVRSPYVPHGGDQKQDILKY